MGEEPKPQLQSKERTCRTCGSALHSDLSRLMERCGPCRVGEDQVGVRDWGHVVVQPPDSGSKTE